MITGCEALPVYEQASPGSIASPVTTQAMADTAPIPTSAPTPAPTEPPSPAADDSLNSPFEVYCGGWVDVTGFDSFSDALAYAKTKDNSNIYYPVNRTIIWTNPASRPASYQIANVGFISQLPDYPRGCEITSLAMLMNYFGARVTKAELADGIAKDDTAYAKINGRIYFGNPNDGFVGSMTDMSKHGFGVYHTPVFNLLSQYFQTSALDITGVDFEDLLAFVSWNRPVWIITNTSFAVLPAKDFETWNTPDGAIDVTYSEHSVLITGYDENFIYFNDPLAKTGGSKAPREAFAAAWEQMGRQAVVITN